MSPPPKTDVNHDDFLWMATDEPHASRRREMLEKYGDKIKPLMGPEPATIPIVIAMVVAQLVVAVLVKDWPLLPWLLVAWAVGGTLNHALFLGIHEIVHLLACKSLWGNRMVAVIANLPIGIPYCASFHGYHIEHHKFQGVDGVDTDLPTATEAKYLNNIFTKFLFCLFQILFYAIRPMLIKFLRFTNWHAVNFIVQGGFAVCFIEAFGVSAYLYFLASTFCAGALHPVSGHFLAEHFLYHEQQETSSYRGPLNMLAFNVGYHIEHHDFPNIPWSRLPLVHKIAPEFYQQPEVKSWPGAIYDFIFRKDMSGFSRVKRRMKLE